MKKIFLLAVAVAAMASCTKTDLIVTDNDLNPISFENFVHKSTKATEATTASLQTSGFKVTACYNPTSGTASDYFANVAVSYNSTNTNFPTTYYWPESGTMDFYAVYPSKTITNKTIASYTTEGAEDLLGAKTTGENCATHNTTKTNVSLTFNHLLTQVYFKIKGSDADNNYKVEKIVLEAKNGATYSFSDGSWTAPATAKTYTYNSTATTFNGATSVVYGTKAANSLMLIPQNNVTVKVYYTVETTAGVRLSTFNEDNNTNNKQYKSFTASSSSVNTDVDWTKGTTVLYELVLPSDVKPIEFTASASTWSADSTQTVNF